MCPCISLFCGLDHFSQFSTTFINVSSNVCGFRHEFIIPSVCLAQKTLERIRNLSEISFQNAVYLENHAAHVDSTNLSVYIPEICSAFDSSTSSDTYDITFNEVKNLISPLRSSSVGQIVQNPSTPEPDSSEILLTLPTTVHNFQETLREKNSSKKDGIISNDHIEISEMNMNSHLQMKTSTPDASSLGSTSKASKINQNQNKTVRSAARSKLPYFILTSRLDSDSDRDEQFSNNSYDTTNSSDCSPSGSLSESESLLSDIVPIVAESSLKVNDCLNNNSELIKLDLSCVSASKESHDHIASVRSKLSKLEVEMKSLEDRGLATEKELRRYESYGLSNCSPPSDISLYSSEPDISVSSHPRSQLSRHCNKSSKLSIWRNKFLKRQSISSAFTNKETVDISNSSPIKADEDIDFKSHRSRLFSELLSLISQRNHLLTCEAELNHRLKQLELYQYQEALEDAYRSLRACPSSSANDNKYSLLPPQHPKIRKKSPLMRFRKLSGRYDKKRSASVGTRKSLVSFPINPCELEPGEDKLLLGEIWRVINKRKALFSIHDEIIQCATLQESSIRKALNKRSGNFSGALSSSREFVETRSQ